MHLNIMPATPEYILAIETATNRGGIALLKHDAVAEVWSGSDGKTLSAELLPEISALLENNGITLSQVKLLAVCSGPGSFTGVRVGLSAAKGFQAALGIPGIAVTLSEALAECADIEGIITSVIPAGRDEVYLQQFRRILGVTETVTPINVLSIDAAAAVIAELPRTICVTTEDLKPEYSTVINGREGKWSVAPTKAIVANVGIVGLRHYLAGGASGLSPLYIKEFAIGGWAAEK